MHVVAFHGSGARPHHLRTDMGDPGWVDEYAEYDRRAPKNYPADLRRHQDLVLVGYSKGGYEIGKLSLRLDNIRAAVLYESPLLDIDKPGGEFPVLIIWNQQSRRINTDEAISTYGKWESGGRRADYRFGNGGHTSWTRRLRTLFRKHAWDQTLNPGIESWIKRRVAE